MILKSKVGAWGVTANLPWHKSMYFEFKKNEDGDFLCDIPNGIEIRNPVSGKLEQTVEYAKVLLRDYPSYVQEYQKEKKNEEVEKP